MFIFALLQLALSNYLIFKGIPKYMDFDLIVFSTIILGRRLTLKIYQNFHCMYHRLSLLQIAIMKTMPLVFFVVLNYVAVRIFLYNSKVNFVCLLHPIFYYTMLFGVNPSFTSMSSSGSQPNEGA